MASPLHALARQGGGLLQLREVLAAGAGDIDALDGEGQTALRIIAELRTDLPAVRELIAAGADVNAADDAGKTALHLVAERMDPATLRELLKAGADPRIADRRGRQALHYVAERAASLPMLQALLDAGCSVNALDISGASPAHLMIENQCHVRMLRALLGAGADPNVLDAEGEAPLHKAAQVGHACCLEALLQAGALPDQRTTRGRTALLTAVLHRHVRCVRVLLPLADVNLPNHVGWTPVFTAALGGPPLAVLRMLLEAGADPTVATQKGETPLYIAAKLGHLSVVRELVYRAGVDVDQRPHADSMTASWFAVEAGHYGIASLLRRAGADPALAVAGHEEPETVEGYERYRQERLQQRYTFLVVNLRLRPSLGGDLAREVGEYV